jgi:hypothetical protein
MTKIGKNRANKRENLAKTAKYRQKIIDYINGNKKSI